MFISHFEVYLILFGLLIIVFLYNIRIKAVELQRREKHISVKDSEIALLERRVATMKKLESLGILTASLAHEIRNPINLITNSSRILNEQLAKLDHEDEKLVKKINSVGEIIYKNSNKINDIVDSLLSSSNIKNFKYETVKFQSFLTKTFLDIEKLMEDKYKTHVKVELDYRLGPDFTVKIATIDFQRLFTNVIENSYYSILQKKKQDKDFKGLIKACITDDEEFFYMEYCDNGIGVKEENIPKIGKPFFTTKAADGGVGLGLYLIHEVTELHGGELAIRSKENEFFEMKFKFLKSFFTQV